MARPRLLAITPVDRRSREFHLAKEEVTVGSEKGNSLLLSAPGVSHRHAVLRPRGAFYEIYDLKSTNGTFVNDRRIDGSLVLTDRDHVRFGPVEFVFLDPEEERKKERAESPSARWLIPMLLVMVAAGFGITYYLFNH